MSEEPVAQGFDWNKIIESIEWWNNLPPEEKDKWLTVMPDGFDKGVENGNQ